MIKTYFCEWRKAYVAYDDNDEPNENGWQQHGDGKTEEEAIEDFLEKVSEDS